MLWKQSTSDDEEVIEPVRKKNIEENKYNIIRERKKSFNHKPTAQQTKQLLPVNMNRSQRNQQIEKKNSKNYDKV